MHRSLKLLDIIDQVRLRKILVAKDLPHLTGQPLAFFTHIPEIPLKRLLHLILGIRNRLVLDNLRLISQLFCQLNDHLSLCLHA